MLHVTRVLVCWSATERKSPPARAICCFVNIRSSNPIVLLFTVI
jgi:hypothetical protein